jgi:5-methylcytosine-specific restriction endonuclease McrA
VSSNSPWHHLYNTKQWKLLRKQQLAHSPLCAFCEKQGKVTPANVVDHKQPHKGDKDLFFAPGNLQSLCKTCHDSAKQRAEKAGIQDVGCDTSGLPLDDSHHWNK